MPYYFNNFSNYHEGDWEHVDVHLNDTLEPVSTAYSQHMQGKKRDWPYVDKTDTHPKVYVARGSHANYYAADEYQVPVEYIPDATDDTEVNDPIHEPFVEVLPFVSSVNVTDLANSPNKWLAFQGVWGELTSLPAGDGPQGPASIPEHSAVWDDPFTWFDNCGWDGVEDVLYSGEFSTSLKSTVASPVELHLYDSQDRHVGKNQAGGIDQEIPGAEYIEIQELHRKTIDLHGGDGTDGYRFVLEGTDSGTFDFAIGSPDRANNISDTIQYLAVPVSVDTVAEVQLDLNKDYTLQIDADDDGTFETQRQPDSVISHSVDLAPPADVDDLSVSNPTSSTVSLTFTAPGDDENAGTAAYYDIRYHTEPITEGNWKEAEPLELIPEPQTAGSTESVLVTGLKAGTQYHFALKAEDEVMHSSGLSNIVSDSTTIPELSWSIQSVYWANWDDYVDRHLSIDYKLSNNGTGIAIGSTIQASLCVPDTVYVVTPLPSEVGDINPSTFNLVTLKYYVPTNVGSFTTTTYVTCEDDASRLYWSPEPLV